jgi:succinate dehydrogenase / fumarate reductase cytochrome b subunit
MNGSFLFRFLRSSLGLKVLMALTGAVLFGFVTAHVSGNLLAFSGPEKMNAYSAMLKSNMGALWGARAVLLLAVAVHLLAANELTKRSAAARPVPYAVKEPHGTTYAARTMRWTGPFLMLFVAYHLLHYTTGHLHPSFVEGDPYHNVVAGFRSVPVALAYIVLMLGLGLHLSHGVWSLLQTLGVNRPAWERTLRAAGLLFGVTICGGFTAVPVAVLFGLIR